MQKSMSSHNLVLVWLISRTHRRCCFFGDNMGKLKKWRKKSKSSSRGCLHANRLDIACPHIMAGLWSDGVHQELFRSVCAERVRQVRKIRGLDEARLFIFTLKSNQLKRVSQLGCESEKISRIGFILINMTLRWVQWTKKHTHKIENIYTCIWHACRMYSTIPSKF